MSRRIPVASDICHGGGPREPTTLRLAQSLRYGNNASLDSDTKPRRPIGSKESGRKSSFPALSLRLSRSRSKTEVSKRGNGPSVQYVRCIPSIFSAYSAKAVARRTLLIYTCRDPGSGPYLSIGCRHLLLASRIPFRLPGRLQQCRTNYPLPSPP